MHLVHLWVVSLPDDEEITLPALEPFTPHLAQWREAALVLSNLTQSHHPYQAPFGVAVRKGLRRKPRFTSQELQDRYLREGSPATEHSAPMEAVRKEFDRLERACVAWSQLDRLRSTRWAVAQFITGSAETGGPSARAVVAAARKRPEDLRISAAVESAAERAREAWAHYSAGHAPHSDEIRLEQQQDLWCSEILNYLLTESIPPGLRGPAIARFVAVCNTYTIRSGLLMRYQTDARAQSVHFQLAIPVALRVATMEAFHEHMGHAGSGRTYSILAQRCYWPGMKEDVRNHVAECHECAMSKKSTCAQGVTMHPEVVSRPFDCVYVDVLTLPDSEPFGPHQLVFSKLLIWVDSLSRFVETVNLPREPNSQDLIQAFVEVLLTRHGAPKMVACDRGPNLVSQLVKGVYDTLGIVLRPSTSGHHESQTLVERYN